MRSSFIARSGLRLMKTPTHRQQMARRWTMAACAMVGLALAAGVVGSLTAPEPDPSELGPRTGPFSYLSE